jgi:FAD binding domain
MSLPSSIILERGTDAYEKSRNRFFNNGHPDRYPFQILHPQSAADVAAAVKYANSLNKHISVRSGGHLFPCQHLQDDEILIDLKGVNPRFEYDPETTFINFGPGQTVEQAQDYLTPRGLFFPFGHSPTVALGGFLLCSGQGYFMQGWGMTADRWLVQLEVVTADGEIRICNRKENTDLFFAARGGGMGFFAIVTKFWGRTSRARKLYDSNWVFKGEQYYEAFHWILDCGKIIRPHHTECTIATFYADKYDDNIQTDEIQSSQVLIMANIVLYADSLEEAKSMVYPYDTCPIPYVAHRPPAETTYATLNADQEKFMPSNQGLRYMCDSILSDDTVSRAEVSYSPTLIIGSFSKQSSPQCYTPPVGDRLVSSSSAIRMPQAVISRGLHLQITTLRVISFGHRRKTTRNIEVG